MCRSSPAKLTKSIKPTLLSRYLHHRLVLVYVRVVVVGSEGSMIEMDVCHLTGRAHFTSLTKRLKWHTPLMIVVIAPYHTTLDHTRPHTQCAHVHLHYKRSTASIRMCNLLFVLSHLACSPHDDTKTIIRSFHQGGVTTTDKLAQNSILRVTNVAGASTCIATKYSPHDPTKWQTHWRMTR